MKNVGQYANAVGWHCYATTDWSVISTFAAAHPGVPQFLSECWTNNDPAVPWTNVADYCLGTITNKVTGVLAWSMTTDLQRATWNTQVCSYCQGLVIVDTSKGTYTKTLDYYILGQFSRFVAVNATVLSITSGSYDYAGSSSPNNGRLLDVAFKNPDGSKVIVFINQLTIGATGSTQVTVSFSSGSVYNGLVAKNGITTWVIPAGQ